VRLLLVSIIFSAFACSRHSFQHLKRAIHAWEEFLFIFFSMLCCNAAVAVVKNVLEGILAGWDHTGLKQKNL